MRDGEAFTLKIRSDNASSTLKRFHPTGHAALARGRFSWLLGVIVALAVSLKNRLILIGLGREDHNHLSISIRKALQKFPIAMYGTVQTVPISSTMLDAVHVRKKRMGRRHGTVYRAIQNDQIRRRIGV